MNPLSPTEYPTLTKYAEDLTLQIAEGQLSQSMSEEDQPYVHRLLQILHRRRKRNPILVGEDQVRKISMVHEVARRIVKGGLPDELTTNIQHIFVFRHDLFFADEKNFDVLADRMSALLNDLKKSEGQIALFINDFHQVVGTLNEKTLSVSKLVNRAQAYGEIRFIGATTSSNYENYIFTFQPFERRSQQVFID
jgi:ATP-dependent Clp protease ATP-binding subunit ClpA